MQPNHIPFNRPFIIGNELQYIQQAIQTGKISGNGLFTKKCQQFFENQYYFKKTLLTTSCTDALEMAAILLDIQPKDEVIIPAYTFVSTANAFVLRGAKIVFADSLPNHPNIDPNQIEALITSKTKAIVVVHYAGIACDMDAIQAIADKHGLKVIEDAAQAIDAFYKGKPLGGIGGLAAFSFHETKNIIAGEGGMLVVNDAQFLKRAEIIWEKGTNRSAFFRGEADKYGWMDVGSSFLPSEIVAAFLYAQIEELPQIQQKRKAIWQRYFEGLQSLQQQGKLQLPHIPDFATNNGHLFYLTCNNLTERTALIQHLRKNDIHAVFHYLSLHQSPFYAAKHDGRKLPNCERFADCLVRLPLFFELKECEQSRVMECVRNFFSKKK
ncbi:MAG: dTDP-4-amino-4,6-dideoxygalactose transaminase [Chitinophagales bacterium]